MPPQLFRQEYEGERENFTGSVYGEWIDEAWLPTTKRSSDYIPEWPDARSVAPDAHRARLGRGPSRSAAVAVSSHGEGDRGGREYLERQRAFGAHLGGIRQELSRLAVNTCGPRTGTKRSSGSNSPRITCSSPRPRTIRWPAFSACCRGCTRSGSRSRTPVQALFDQMKKYRYAENVMPDGSKREKEKVYKKEDELPDCVRYALMTWPSLPKAGTRSPVGISA
jgi:hypothetical protein